MYIGTKEHALFVLSALDRGLGGSLSYDEALKLYKESAQFVEDCGPYDPATEHFVRQRRMMLDYMQALNIRDDLQRTDHLDFYKVMIVGHLSGNVDEVEVGVLKHSRLLGHSDQHFANTVLKRAASKLVMEGKTKLRVMDNVEEIILL